MEVKNIIICDDVLNQQGTKGEVPNLISPYANIVLPVIPTTYSFSIFVIIDGAPENPGRFDINFYYHDTPEDLINSISIVVDQPTQEQMSSKVPSSINFAINMRNILFKKTGDYIVDVLYDDKKLCSQSVSIHKAVGDI